MTYTTVNVVVVQLQKIFCVSVTKIHISRVAQVQSRAGGYAIEFFGVCFIVAIYLRWFKEEKCLNVRQKLGTRNVIENLKNLKNYSHSLIQLQKKTIAIFSYKQRLLSIDMKTKVVQHVPRIILLIYICGMLFVCLSSQMESFL